MNLKSAVIFARTVLTATALLLIVEFAFAAKPQADEYLIEARAASALELLESYEYSEMMLMYTELAQKGIRIETPEGSLSKRKAKKLAKEHSARVEAIELAMSERAVRDLSGDFNWEIAGDCEAAKAWWPAMGQLGWCGNPTITQDGMDLKIVHHCAHEGEELDMTQVGRTLDDAVIVVEELNSDFVYLGQIDENSISFRVNVENVLARWPSFEVAPTREALNGCTFVLSPRS